MINRIIDHIYISDVEDVLGGCPLREHEITHVLTVSAVDVPENQHVSNVKYHFVFVMDLPNFDILGGGQLSECVAYINDAVQCNGNVLIHCEAGVSRSVTVVSAYIMQKLKLTVEEAIDIVKKSRPLACPNSGFFRQLQIYEQLHYKTDEYLLSQCCMYKDWSISPGGSTLKGSSNICVC
ncbi:dual specificity phosphatase, catalytic domain protein [Dictyocaulus viviparus]|uniref:Dual specificity phosphatase, catalytic domain protein n=1 Tax=Dictyocaulus viviparus TaxID=29172 RepID=A0A0D8XA67_DICVI|nr:dual specificity phosphatase, catalytic domain protein [Dictyocaulus viviparus]